jgi:hypothetical protein
MNTTSVSRDERTVAVENESFRWAYLVLSYGLLVIVVYRAFVFDESSWDLLILVVLGGGIASLYQGISGILTTRAGMLSAVSLIVAAAMAVFIAWLR